MRVLIVGMGSIGRRHAGNLMMMDRDVRLSVVEPRELKNWSVDFAYDHFYSLNECLEKNKSFDACLICSPSELHVKHLNQMVGKTNCVFVEKPCCTSVNDANELISLSDKFKVSMVGCNIRFHEGFQRLKSNLGLVGELTLVRSYFGHWLPNWRPEQDYSESYSAKINTGGALLDCIHEPDAITALIGPYEEVIDLQRHKLSNLRIDSEDFAFLIGSHEDQVASICQIDYLRPIKRREIEVHGSLGLLRWSSEGKNPEQAQVSLVKILGKKTEKKVLFKDEIDPNSQYMKQLGYFLDCVEQLRQSINSLVDNAKMMSQILSRKESEH